MEPIEEYHTKLKERIDAEYELSRKARSLGLDPSRDVEAMPAGDLADRVEGLVGPEGVSKVIKRLTAETDKVVARLIDEYIGGKIFKTLEEREKAAEQMVRTSLAVQTEGVVAAPIEGISAVNIKKNPDGSEYLSISFAGPIRSAGGTAQGLAVLVGEYIARSLGLAEFRPTNDEIERYVEEIRIYNDRINNLQYNPSEDEVRHILRHLKVCVDGDATEDMEVAVHRDLKRFNSNRIRGGICLVIAEGVAQKSKKLIKNSEEFNIDWSWLADLKKSVKEDADGEKPIAKFMNEVVGGRPIFCAPSAKGALRLVYGHSRDNGIAAKSFHPATMIMLDDFVATGTQVKIEKPGKGCIATECDTIDGPIVKLKNGSVLRVQDRKTAYEVLGDVEEIIFLGDILVTFGDFLHTNTQLVPSGYVKEWWIQESKGANPEPTPAQAVDDALKLGIPLHPKYCYYFQDVDGESLLELATWLCQGNEKEEGLVLKNSSEKRILELIGVPHDVSGGDIIISEYIPLLAQLGCSKFDTTKLVKAVGKLGGEVDGFKIVLESSEINVRNKGGAYIGCRMGRPEKARERKMQPAVHGLFPIGDAGGRERSINAAVEQNRVEVEVSQFVCPKCREKIIQPFCYECGETAIELRSCRICSYSGNHKECPKCKKPTLQYAKTNIDLKYLWAQAIKKIGKSTTVKGVIGMISESKIPEPIEKGLVRAINQVYVFKDGTIRFDATDAPLTHFKPREIGLSVKKTRELGYKFDYLGADIESVEQIIELFTQDIIISEYGGDYMLRVAKFIDNLLMKFYGMKPYYNALSREDMLGQIIVGLAPHTSAGITGRIIGYTKANVIYAHPFWHAAKRRNADGDEDAIMLLMDTLLNFSKSYLPQKRGGKMDAPLVVTTIMNPKEVDDEAHKIEVATKYPIEFYEKTLMRVNPSDIKQKIVADILDKHPHTGIGFTHDTYDITGPVVKSRYVTLDSMADKIDAQLAVAEKIRAIDEREVANIVINSHFMRDTYGNLRAFSRQHFRCVKCNENYKRVPLVGKCTVCGGKLLLTVSKGNITKYLGMSLKLAEKYKLSGYLVSRLRLVENAVESLTVNDLEKQISLVDFM